MVLMRCFITLTFAGEKEAIYYKDLITSAKRENEEEKEYYLK